MKAQFIRTAKRRGTRVRGVFALALAAACAAAIAPRAEAATAYWYGTSGTLWSTATNWSTSPTASGTYTLVNGDSLRWIASSTNRTNYNDLTSLSVSGLSWQGATGSFVLNGNKLTLSGGISFVPTSATINLPLELNVGSLTMEGGNSALTINGNITEIGGSRALQLQSGTAILTGTNSFSGGMIIGVSSNSAFSVNALANIGVAQPLGTGTGANATIELRNGSIIYTGTTASTNIRIQIGRNTGGNSATTGFTNNGTGAVTWTGTQALANLNTNSSSVFTLGGSNANDNTWQSVIADNTATGLVGVTKTGAGKWMLSGANTYSGTTTVSGGVLGIANNLALQNSPLDTSGAGTVSLTVTTPTLGGLVGSKDLTSVITSGYGSVTSLTLNPGAGRTFTYNGTLADGAAGMTLTKTGSGTQTLGGVNSYTGNTTISAGALQLGISGSSLPGNIANAASLGLFQVGGATGVVGGLISGTGSVTMSGSGTVRLSNASNSYTGKTTIAGGTLEVASIQSVGGGASPLGAPTTAANGTIDLGSTTTPSATLRYTGTGNSSDRILNLSGTSNVTIEAVGSGPLVLTATNTDGGSGTRTFTLNATGTSVNQIGPIAGTGVSVNKTGSGLWRLTGLSGYDGQLQVLDGTIVVATTVTQLNNGPFGSNTGTASLPIIGNTSGTASGTAALLVANGVSVDRGFSIASSGSGGSQIVVLGGVGSGTATFSGAPTIRVGRDLTLQASNGGTAEFNSTWAGTSGTAGSGPAVVFTVGSSGNAGTVRFGSNLPSTLTGFNIVNGTAEMIGLIAPATPVTVGSTLGAATLDLNGLPQTLSRLTFAGNSGSVTTGTTAGGTLRLANSGSVGVSGTGHVISSAVALDAASTFNTGSGAALTVSNVISNGTSGSQSLTKTGLGTLTLAGNNTYSGSTSIAAGRLAVNGSLASAVTVQAGATLGGSGRLAGTLTGDGLIAPGNSPGILTVDGQIAPTASTSFAFEFTGTGSPTWSNASASVNDVLRLTNSDPFTSGLGSGNIVNIYFDVASLVAGDMFLGGFFSDRTSGQLDFMAELGLPAYQFFVLGDGSGTATSYMGKSYYTLPQYNPSLTGATVSVTTVPTANFASGDVTNGQVTQFVIVPEPGAMALAAIGIAAAAWARRRRRV